MTDDADHQGDAYPASVARHFIASASVSLFAVLLNTDYVGLRKLEIFSSDVVLYSYLNDFIIFILCHEIFKVLKIPSF